MTAKNWRGRHRAKNSINIEIKKGEDPDQKKSDLVLGEFVAPLFATLKYTEGTIGEVSLENAMHSMLTSAERVSTNNNLASVEAMLVTQAYSLNLLFSECLRRSAVNSGDYPEASHRYFTMALKAQNQSRMTLETLSNIKNPPIVYAKQANIANGPQQVNNGPAPRAHAEENQNQPNKLLEQSHEKRMDIGTKSAAGNSHPPMETVAEGDRSQVNGKQG